MITTHRHNLLLRGFGPAALTVSTVLFAVLLIEGRPAAAAPIDISPTEVVGWDSHYSPVSHRWTGGAFSTSSDGSELHVNQSLMKLRPGDLGDFLFEADFRLGGREDNAVGFVWGYQGPIGMSKTGVANMYRFGWDNFGNPHSPMSNPGTGDPIHLASEPADPSQFGSKGDSNLAASTGVVHGRRIVQEVNDIHHFRYQDPAPDGAVPWVRDNGTPSTRYHIEIERATLTDGSADFSVSLFTQDDLSTPFLQESFNDPNPVDGRFGIYSDQQDEFIVSNMKLNPVPTPEPATLLLIGLGTLGLFGYGRRLGRRGRAAA